jgi:hypothetical protein
MDHLSDPKPASDVTVYNPDPDDQGWHTWKTGKNVRDNEYYFELVVFKVIIRSQTCKQDIKSKNRSGWEYHLSCPQMLEPCSLCQRLREMLKDRMIGTLINLPVNEEGFRWFLRTVYPFR